jgi:DNA-binding response OmpR family regulator
MGHHVTAVDDGAAAWEAFQREHPTLLIVDWLMPEIDGVELSRRVRAAEGGRDVYILMATGRGTSEDLATALDAGVDDYITKPVSPEHLRARVAIAERRIAQEAARRGAEEALARARWLAGIGEAALAMQHELNTPLATLMGELALLAETATSAEQRRAVDAADAQAQRIARVVRRLAAAHDPQSVEPVPGLRMLDLSEGR